MLTLANAAVAVSTPRSAASLVAEASGASVHALQHGPSPTAPNGLGVCVTGMMRTLMAEPVVDSFDRYIRQTAHETDVHMVISVENGTDPYSFGSGGQMDRDQLTRRIRASWQPDSLVLMPSHDVEPWQCDIMPSLDYPSREAGTWDTYRAAPQWFAMRVCYGQIERAEEARGAQYAWLLRTRSDFVPLEPLPLASLAPSFGYMPRGGFAPDTQYMCQNDHLFLCPRALCRGYFRLLEIWQSPHCTRNATHVHDVLHSTSSIFAHAGPNGELTMNGATEPTEPFLVPELSVKSMSGHFIARYASHDQACVAGVTPETCCGLLREFGWAYTIARGTNDVGLLECEYTLVGGVRLADRADTPASRRAMSNCQAAHAAYSANLSAAAAAQMCDAMPDEFYQGALDNATRALAAPEQSRRAWCRSATGQPLHQPQDAVKGPAK